MCYCFFYIIQKIFGKPNPIYPADIPTFTLPGIEMTNAFCIRKHIRMREERKRLEAEDDSDSNAEYK